MSALTFFIGALGWSITEYVLHRFAGHRKTGLAFSKDHLQHHRDPKYFISVKRKLKRSLAVFLVLASLRSGPHHQVGQGSLLRAVQLRGQGAANPGVPPTGLPAEDLQRCGPAQPATPLPAAPDPPLQRPLTTWR